ncbi:transcriptional regulator [Streptoalloteichus hindustanus]|uniref:Transcriptional regulator n=1 Tax=Streptoalloteichus hindustanus TaxID=2017 RepID=A0A1M5CTK4_STRHI|nr:transcriptional regulator [Streptoalloteichus hindustanus]SHF58016.1 transcriptional regulator [Streptoalloteichus hindustanus]
MDVRSRAGRQPNERLRAVMEEAGCSNTGLARRVNVCGAEHGLHLRYDKTSVARWLRGQQPRGRAPVIIAQALGRKLGRMVTVEEIGMTSGQGAAPTVGLRFEPTVPGALRQARALWRGDAHRTGALTGERLSTSVLVQPSRDWLIAGPDAVVAGHGPAAVRTADLAVLRATTASLAELDHRFGSGRLRPVVVHYLDSVVSGLVAGSYGEASGRQLLGAVARLTELAGYMAVDTGQPGLAQRYYIQALRLAQAADDRGLGGYVLASGMSRVALQLGSPQEAVQLARAAQEGTRARSTPTVAAACHAAEARGHALLGDARACQQAIGKAVAVLEHGDPDSHPGSGLGSGLDGEPDWAGHVDHAYLAEELARCSADLQQRDTAARWAQEALRGCPPDRARRRALRLLLVASTQLRLGEVDLSCGTAAQAVEVLGGLHSAQCASDLADFCGRLEAQGRREEARALLAEPDRNCSPD